MLIAMRVLSASAASSVQSVGAGSVADVWAVEERGTAMGIFYIGQLAVGTLLGPLIGGLLTEEWGWRATQWFLAIYAAIVLILIVLCLPETSARAEIHTSSVSDTMNAIDEKQSLGEEALRQSDLHSRPKVKTFIQLVVEPFHVLTYLRFAAISTTIFIASMAFGTLGLLNVSIQETFSHSPYSLSTIVIGCLYIPIGSGNIFGSVFGGRWSDSIMRRQARKHARYDASGELVYKVEDRVAENAWIAVTSYAGLLVLYGWVVEKGVHWVVPVSLIVSSIAEVIC